MTATVVLACLIVAAVAIVYSLRQPTTANAGPSGSSTSAVSTPPDTSAVSTSPDTATIPTASGTARVQTAVSGADSATTAAQSELDSLSGIPTPAKVAAVINPYAYSLQLYESFLSGSPVPAAAWSEKISTDAQMGKDLEFLNTINELPSLRLGAYLRQFSTVAAQLHASLSTLEADLRSSTP